MTIWIDIHEFGIYKTVGDWSDARIDDVNSALKAGLPVTAERSSDYRWIKLVLGDGVRWVLREYIDG